MTIPLRLILMLAAIMAGACGGDGASSGDLIEGSDVRVRMFDNRYEYTEVHIPSGGSVTWVGGGRNPHNTVAADGSWSTETVFGSLDQFDGDEALITYTEPGEYLFFCTYHGNAEGVGMAGRLIVEDAP